MVDITMDDDAPAVPTTNVPHIQRLEANEREIQEKLARLEQELTKLSLLKSTVMRTIAMHTTGIYSLPSELIAEIALLACIRGLPPYPTASNSAQLNITRVCKTWRNILMEVPEFWSKLIINLESKPEDSEVDAMDRWLERSFPTAIDLQVCLHAGNRRNTLLFAPDPIHGFMQPVRRHIKRCKRATISLPAAYLSHILPAQTNEMLQLEQLSFTDAWQTGPVLICDLGACPRLTHLNGSTRCNVIFLGQGQLVKEINSALPQRSVLDLLERCPLITTCRLILRDTTRPPRLDDNTAPIIRLPELSQLDAVLQNVRLHTIGALLFPLCLPSLERLRLVEEYKDETPSTVHDAWPYLTNLFQRSHPPLVELDISPSTIDSASLIEALALVPSLRSLVLHNYTPGISIWWSLTMVDHNDNHTLDIQRNICPELTTLAVTNCQTVDIHAVSDMLLTRCFANRPSLTASRPLQSLHLNLADSCELVLEDLLEHPGLGTCVEDGLEIHIDTGKGEHLKTLLTWNSRYRVKDL